MLFFSVIFVQVSVCGWCCNVQLVDNWLLLNNSFLHKEPRFRKVLSGLCLLERKGALFLIVF